MDMHFKEDFEKDHEQYLQIFTNNKEFIKESVEHDPQYFIQLSKGQTPKYLIIGCSDSRVPPNEITKLKAGEIFTHRNIANQVIPADMNVNSVIQYAVEHLKVKHIIVMGHSKCGGVQAAIQGTACGGMLDLWLSYIKDVFEKYEDEINDIDTLDKKVERLSELNIVEQVVNVWKNPYVQKSWKKGHPVWVHGWIFRTGLLDEIVADRGMPIDMKAHQFKFNENDHDNHDHKKEEKNELIGQYVIPEPNRDKMKDSIWPFDEFLQLQTQMMHNSDNSHILNIEIVKKSNLIHDGQEISYEQRESEVWETDQ